MATYDIVKIIPGEDGSDPKTEPAGTFTEGPNNEVPSLYGYILSLQATTGFEHGYKLSDPQPKDAKPGAGK